MIKTIPHSKAHNFSNEHGGFITRYREIPKEEFDRINLLSKAELNAEIEDCLPEDILIGYGYYGGGVFAQESENRFYYWFEQGASCE